MMKKNYEEPAIEVVVITDVITDIISGQDPGEEI